MMTLEEKQDMVIQTIILSVQKLKKAEHKDFVRDLFAAVFRNIDKFSDDDIQQFYDVAKTEDFARFNKEDQTDDD